MDKYETYPEYLHATGKDMPLFEMLKTQIIKNTKRKKFVCDKAVSGVTFLYPV